MNIKYKSVNQNQLQIDIEEIRDIIGKPSQEDFSHLKKMQRWGKGLALMGYFLAGIVPFLILTYANGLEAYIYLSLFVGAFFISFANFSRWANFAHPILHGGYDKVENIPSKYTRKGFANTKLRRFLDWQDWIYPQAWDFEHNIMHHYHLGESEDPDNIQQNTDKLIASEAPDWMPYLMVVLLMFLWKPLYYAPNTMLTLSNQHRKRQNSDSKDEIIGLSTYKPFTKMGSELWTNYYLPYISFRFIVLPLLFLPLGFQFTIYVLIASVIAELMTNLHSFFVIAPNHSGDDVYQFDTPHRTQGEFYLRQIIGSTKYNTGSDILDFSQGWLNYQIEHHLFPNLPLLQYQKMQPLVKEVCAKHGLPYNQESIFIRFYKTIQVMTGHTKARRIHAS